MAKVTARPRKQSLCRSAVQVDVVLVRKHQLHQPERVGWSGLLPYLQLPRAKLPEDVISDYTRSHNISFWSGYLIAFVCHVAAVFVDRRNDFGATDGWRYVPVRTEHDELHIFFEDWRLGAIGLPHNNVRSKAYRAVTVKRSQTKFRNVDDDRRLRQFVWHPAPALQSQT